MFFLLRRVCGNVGGGGIETGDTGKHFRAMGKFHDEDSSWSESGTGAGFFFSEPCRLRGKLGGSGRHAGSDVCRLHRTCGGEVGDAPQHF